MIAKLKGLLFNLCFIALPVALLCWAAAEVCFRWVVPACQVPERRWLQEFKIPTFDPEGPRDGLCTKGKFAQIRGRWHINDAGWNSAVEYRTGEPGKKPRIAIVGDSYVEAFYVDVDKSLAADLRRELGEKADVYSFGLSGASLAEYLQLSRYVARQYAPDILVVNVVHNDFDESLAEVSPEPSYLRVKKAGDAFQEVEPTWPYHRNWIGGVLRRSALYRYVTSNLGVRRQIAGLRSRGGKASPKRNYAANVDVDAVKARRAEVEEVTRYLVRKIRDENGGRAVLFMVDAPRSDLYEGNLAGSRVAWLNELLQSACEESACPCLDLTAAFKAHWDAHHEHFEWPIDGHWNALGHEVAARALWQELTGTEETRRILDGARP